MPPTAAAGRRIRIVLVRDDGLYPAAVRALLTAQSDFWVYDLQAPCRHASELVTAFGPQLLISDRHTSRRETALLQAVLACCQRAPLVLMQGMASEGESPSTPPLDHPSVIAVHSADPAELMDTIRTLVLGVLPPTATVSARVPRQSGTLAATEGPESGAGAGELSPRERQILAMVAAGKSSQRIADSLRLSVCTVSKHRANLMRKLGCHNAAGLTRLALSFDLLG